MITLMMKGEVKAGTVVMIGHMDALIVEYTAILHLLFTRTGPPGVN